MYTVLGARFTVINNYFESMVFKVQLPSPIYKNQTILSPIKEQAISPVMEFVTCLIFLIFLRIYNSSLHLRP